MTTAYSGDGITFPDNSVQATAPRVGMVNRIINGDMRIDQRNAGASVTVTNGVQYTIDRYRTVAIGTSLGFSVQQSSTAPSGFANSLLATVTTAKAVASSDQTRIDQFVEGFNISDLGWGTASATTVTLSFWVRSSVTGTYCVEIGNSTSPTRSYLAEYTISSANTFEYKTIVIAGDTTGTWATGNSVGVALSFVLGMGSAFNGSTGWQAGEKFQTTNQTQWIANSGATFYITGVQLEKGSTATDFEYVDYGRQLQMCQRYLPSWSSVSGTYFRGGQCYNTSNAIFILSYPVPPRVAATGVTSTGAFGVLNANGSPLAATGGPNINGTGLGGLGVTFSVSSGLTAGNATNLSAYGGTAAIYGTGCEL